MKSRKFLTVVTVVMIVAMMVACGSSGNSSSDSSSPAVSTGSENTSTDTYTLKLGSTHFDPYSPATNKFISFMVGNRVFVENIEKYTDGRVKIEGFYNATLGSAPELFQQVMLNELDFVFSTPMSSIDARYSCFSLPYTYKDLNEVVAAVNPVNGPVFKVAEKWFAEKDMKLVVLNASFMRGFVNSKHAVHVPGDVKDMKVRVLEDKLVSTFWNGLATTSVIPQAEVFSALQTKTVDAMELAATSVYAMHLNEVTQYYSTIDWMWASGGTVAMPLGLWDSLPTDIQDAITQAAKDMFDAQAAQELYDTTQIYDALTDELGMEVTKITDAERQEWVDYARSLDDQFKKLVGEDAFNEYMAAVDESRKMMAEGKAYVVEPTDLVSQFLN